MGFDVEAMRTAVARHGRVARVVVAAVAGSVPREVGAEMLVWDGGQSGTIGGGALEFEAARLAFTRAGATRHALGPELGQCCGGAVTLWTERVDAKTLTLAQETDVVARGPGDMPLSVRSVLDTARAQGVRPATALIDGWMVEPVAQPSRKIWIWGAGHVGRALVEVLHPLTTLAITWLDTGPDRFPSRIPPEITPLWAEDLPRLAAHAPQDAEHLILTYSHELDLALCHALLQNGFAEAGVIGSDTKWARFRNRLRALGHTDQAITRITCPIGQKHLGKHPQAIAIGVASDILSQATTTTRELPWMTSCSA
ncbi:MAG: xanthine dehydrogenase accessory protein XdhC [Rhodobacteraceae bacterium]|nr:xanthine dehydrogenase accessory protein XdhC [Paracoccaceae bacterium]